MRNVKKKHYQSSVLMFLRLKAQAPEVPDNQVITQDIKALRAGQLHSHLTREKPRTIQELYENFEKFSKSEVLHFRKLEQQRKAPKESEAPRPTKFQRSTTNTTQPRVVNSKLVPQDCYYDRCL